MRLEKGKVHRPPQDSDLKVLKKAVKKSSTLLREQGISEDQIVADFQAIRK